MPFQPRPYQQGAIEANINFFNSNENFNGINILPTGSGKSLVIALTAAGLKGKTVVFQPSKEILQQNFAKFLSYGYRAGVYSASAGMKHLDNVTFATIGSVAKKHHIFKQFDNIIIDECHLVNPEEGMYYNFINSLNHAKVLGLTATPYRLTSTNEGLMLKFITNSTPRIFSKVLYCVQNDVLFNNGFLAKLEYCDFNVIDRTMLELNDKGTDFTVDSMRSYYRRIDMPSKTVEYANMILDIKDNLLVFCGLLEEAYSVAKRVPGSVVLTGETPLQERENILSQFTKGIIKCVINVGVLTTGFDFPALQAVLIARSTNSLSLYYQIVGRVMRPHHSKETGLVVDLGGNIHFFGKIETMQIMQNDRGKMSLWNNGRQLTDVPLLK